MKPFLKRLFLFIISVFILLVILEFTLRVIPNNYSYKNNLLKTNADKIEILVLGSSHTLYGINPDFFTKKGFNAAHLAQSLKYDYFIFHKYKDKLKNLKILIIPISYFSLFYRLEDGTTKWRIKNYALYYGCKYNSEFKFNCEMVGKKPFKVLKIFSKYLFKKSNVTVTDSGFGLLSNKQPECFPRSGPYLAKKQTNLDLELLKENTIYLDKLIQESNQMGVRVILLTTPARKYYIKNLNKIQLSLMMKTIENAKNNYNNVEYYNFLNDDRFEDNDFKDADHLNAVGAEKFTKILDKLINK